MPVDFYGIEGIDYPSTEPDVSVTMEEMRRMEHLYSNFSKQYEEPEEPKPVNVMPRKMNKLKEWSISARALERVIINESNGRARFDYKFGAIYDERYKISRIWNLKTKNVVCSVKSANGKIIIRYRPNSYYASKMASLTDRKLGDRKITAIPSDKLAIHRGNSEHALYHLRATKEAQLGLRMDMYQDAIYKRQREAEKLATKQRRASNAR